MKKINLLLLHLNEKLEEILKHQKDAKNQGNPHLTTKYQAQAAVYIYVIQKANEIANASSTKKRS